MEIAELTLGPLEWAALILIGLYLVTRIPWWLRQVCVPSPAFVEWVQERCPRWGETASGWITSFPSAVSTFGFLATPLWFLIIGLNLALLAQSLELILPAAGRVELSYFGSYTWITLLAAAIFTIAQTAFGVGAGEAKRRSLVVLLLILVVISIGAEVALAGWRSAVVLEDPAHATDTPADALMSKGIALTMLITFLVSVGHTILGFVAVPRFLAPVIGYVPKLIGGVLTLVWSWFMRFYFGFQQVVIVPMAISQLRNETSALTSRVSATASGVKTQQANFDTLQHMSAPFSAIQEQVRGFSSEGPAVRAEWKSLSSRLSDELAKLDSGTSNGSNAEERRASILDEANTFKTSSDNRLRTRITEAKRLSSLLEDLPRVHLSWQAKHADLLAQVPHLANETVQSRRDLEDMRAFHARCAEALRPGMAIVPYDEGQVGQIDPVMKELRDLRQRAVQAVRPSEQARINRVLGLCVERIAQTNTDLNAVEIAILKNERALLDLGKNCANVPPPAPPPPPELVDAAKLSLAIAMHDMVSAAFEVSASVSRFIKENKRKKRGGPFAWIARIFAEFIDAIMGANTPKPKPPSDPAGNAPPPDAPAFDATGVSTDHPRKSNQ